MAGPASNFDSEIKKGMKAGEGGPPAKSAKSSTNTVPSGKDASGSGKQNQWKAPPASAPQHGDTSAQTLQPKTDPTHTGQAMMAAGQSHMDAIHAHINAMSGGR